MAHQPTARVAGTGAGEGQSQSQIWKGGKSIKVEKARLGGWE